MSDEEVVRALLMLARKLGVENRLVVAIQHGIGDRETAARDDALCLAVDKYRETRLCCTYAKGHDRACSWVGAMIGKSACIAKSWGGPDAVKHLCQRPTHHAGEHKAHGADGVRWTWGDAPSVPAVNAVDWDTVELMTESPEIRCEAQEWGTNGHRMSCVLVRGHEGAHRGVDADGQSMVTWPCPCYPDCAGHVETPKSCRSHSPRADNGAYFTCVLPAGHETEHRSITALGPKTWGLSDDEHRAIADKMRAKRLCLNATTLPGGYFADCRLPTGHAGDHAQGDTTWQRRGDSASGELGTVCGAPSPLQPGPDCVYRAGHGGSHSNDPTEPRA